MKGKFKFIDLFAGIGGFHIAMHSVGGECVFASEWDKFARITYEHNFKNISPKLFSSGNFNADINDADVDKIPDFDVLCGGFPCQAFSNAGLKKGFDDTRGTLFFNIADIVKHKIDKGFPPKVLLLENVKGLKSHDKGKTFKKILEVLDGLGYKVNHEVLSSKNFGVPQNRQRIFIVAWLKGENSPESFSFPFGLDINNMPIMDKEDLEEKVKPVKVGDILESKVDEKYTISDRLHAGHLRRLSEHKEKGNGFGFSLFNKNSPYTSTISARYYKDGSEILIEQKGKNPRKLSPKEAGLLQGYSIGKGYSIVVSDVQAYKQFGNSVSVPVVTAIAKQIKKQLL
ncbi:DNA cytosine methyltransferase [Taibaiella lutea]|nr:DNA (cytosine-5-)-methyltransferase [Taibaiella lutea]